MLRRAPGAARATPCLWEIVPRARDRNRTRFGESDLLAGAAYQALVRIWGE